MRNPDDCAGRRARPDDDAYRDLIAPMIGPLLSTARRVLRDEALAWDAVQEALIQLWKEPSPPPNARGWLIRAVVFRSLYLARTRARRRNHERKASVIRAESSSRDDPSSQLAYRELAAEVDRLIARLPPGCREVVQLRSDDELDYAEIARVLNIPIGTVRSRLNRTRKWIQDAIAPDDEDGRAGHKRPASRALAAMC